MNPVTHNTTAVDAEASFADYRLSETTIQALTKMGITNPTPIQAMALPILIEGHDVIGQARTGSGKTLAFGIPALEHVDVRQRAVQVMVLTPTRELAVQIAGVLEELGASRGISVGLLFGGRAEGPQRLMLKKGVHVVVGTPGRVLDMLNQGALWLDKVRFLVLDEADEMLDRGFAPDVERILDRTTAARQTAMFSATVPDWVRKTADRHLHNPETIAVDPNPEDCAPIDHMAYDVGNGDKMTVLRHLLDQRGEGSIIVFGRTKHGVKKLARMLDQAGYPVAALQGNLSQNARDQVMEDFRSGRTAILVATNVAARGLDITHVEQVINYELPESHQLLTHRIGRTGRMGRQGSAITILSSEDVAKWRQLEKGLGRTIPRLRWQGAKFAPVEPSPVAAEAVAPVEASANRNRKPRPKKAATYTLPAPDQQVAPPAPERPRSVDPLGDFLSKLSTAGNNIAPVRAASSQAEMPRTRSQSGNRSQQRGDRQEREKQGGRHQIECSACGVVTTVPFEPRTGRPVYCRPCFSAMRPPTSTQPQSGKHDIRSSGAETTYAD